MGNSFEDEEFVQWFVDNCETLDEAAEVLRTNKERFIDAIEDHEIETDWDTELDLTPQEQFEPSKLPDSGIRTDLEEPEIDVNTISKEQSERFEGVMGVYVLKCEDDKWYVGCSVDVGRRINEHSTGHGSLWTKRHLPEEIVNVIPCDEDYERMTELEDHLTLRYMERESWRDVRGGVWWHPAQSAPPEPLHDDAENGTVDSLTDVVNSMNIE